MEKRHESTKDLIDEILCRLNTIQKVKVEEEFDDALYGVCSQRTSKNISRKRVLIQLEQLELLTLFT